MSDRGAAEYLLDHPLLNEILDGLEQSAIEQARRCKFDEDLKRFRLLEQANAVENVRAELERRAAPPTNRKRGSVA